MLPKISIIVPIYNVEEYLNRCLDSIINQTYENLEIILINDGSTDNSYFIAEYYKNLDSRVILINQENGGQAKARNIGIKISTGDYLLFVDSDDWIDEDCVKLCLESALDAKSDLVVFDIRLIKQNGIKYEEFDLTIYNSHSGPCNKLYKKELWNGKIFPENVWYEDLGIIPIIVGKCKNKVKLNKPLYNYDFTRQCSQSHQIDKERNSDIMQMLDLVYKELKNDEYEPELEYLFIKHLVSGLILRKATLIKNNKDRNYIIENALNYLEGKYPNWRQNKYYIFNKSLQSRVEKSLIMLIKKRQYGLLSLLWKVFIKINKLRSQLKLKIIN
ncbi:glycosyltransferase family 2 protein [Cytobacillus firmus]|uniref:glycosyltransferase family 2 protein n=1 Tax=Cytobacillus pseudoceanisediminis TaxID=3051614 RepID=UPI0021627F15|nr:glycosyltransferase family 2 protein [Cytobacillus firmus]